MASACAGIVTSELQWGLGMKAEELYAVVGVEGLEDMLQWGLGMKAEEFFPSPIPDLRSTTLQWGLGMKAEELARFTNQGITIT